MFVALTNALIQFDWIVDKHNNFLSSEYLFTHYLKIMILVSNHEENKNGVEAGLRVLSDQIDRIENKQDLMESATYISFNEHLSSYYTQLDLKPKVKDCHERIFRRTYAHLKACLNKEECTYDNVAISLFKMGEYETATELFELALNQGEFNHTMDKIHLLINLISSYSKLKNSEMVQQMTQKLYDLHNHVMNITVPELFWYKNTVISLIVIYEELGYFLEARMVFARILEFITAELCHGAKLSYVTASSGQELKFSTLYEMLQQLFVTKQYAKIVELTTIVISAMNELKNDHPEAEVLPNKLSLQLIAGRAKFHGQNYSEGMREIEYVLETILSHPEEGYHEDDKITACWELFPRIAYIEPCYDVRAEIFERIIKIVGVGLRLFLKATDMELIILLAGENETRGLLNFLSNVNNRNRSNLMNLKVSDIKELMTMTRALTHVFSDVLPIDPTIWQYFVDNLVTAATFILKFTIDVFLLCLRLTIYVVRVIDQVYVFQIIIVWIKLMALYSVIITMIRVVFHRSYSFINYFLADLLHLSRFTLLIFCIFVLATPIMLVTNPKGLLEMPAAVLQLARYVRDPRFKYGQSDIYICLM